MGSKYYASSNILDYLVMLHALYIINKSGGLIYQQDLKDLSPAAPKLSSNDHLRLGSTFHSMHAIAALVIPD